MDALVSAVERRYKTMVKTSIKLGVAPPSLEMLLAKATLSLAEGFKCCYCGSQLLIKDRVYPHLNSFSFDHERSLYRGGNNESDNLVVCCHRCNIIKSTMSAETFRELLRLCPTELVDRMFLELWEGKIANKLEREDS